MEYQIQEVDEILKKKYQEYKDKARIICDSEKTNLGGLMKRLENHTSPETAYVVDDYPYGFRLRCKIRYWLEFRKGYGTRLCSQTTNPKKSGEVWNKEKCSTYHNALAILFLDDDNHVSWATCECYSVEDIKKFELKYDSILSEKERNLLWTWRVRLEKK